MTVSLIYWLNRVPVTSPVVSVILNLCFVVMARLLVFLSGDEINYCR